MSQILINLNILFTNIFYFFDFTLLILVLIFEYFQWLYQYIINIFPISQHVTISIVYLAKNTKLGKLLIRGIWYFTINILICFDLWMSFDILGIDIRSSSLLIPRTLELSISCLGTGTNHFYRLILPIGFNVICLSFAIFIILSSREVLLF